MVTHGPSVVAHMGLVVGHDLPRQASNLRPCIVGGFLHVTRPASKAPIKFISVRSFTKHFFIDSFSFVSILGRPVAHQLAVLL